MDDLKDKRWKQRFENFEKAYNQFASAVAQAGQLNDLEKEGLVQRFGSGLHPAKKYSLMPYGISEKSFHYMMEAFSTFEEIEAVVLFGSRAMGNHKHGSDIDIALKGPQINAGIARRLQGMLNEEVPIPYTVDVVDYDHLEHDGLRKHIDEVGIVIYRQQITARESN